MRQLAACLTASPTLTIDRESEPGSWREAIAHTPGLIAADYRPDPAPPQDTNAND